MRIITSQVFSAEFKQEAVALLGKVDRDVAQLAIEPVVRRSRLYSWKEEPDAYARKAFPGKGKRNPHTTTDETAGLRAEHRRLQEENEILEKAAFLRGSQTEIPAQPEIKSHIRGLPAEAHMNTAANLDVVKGTDEPVAQAQVGFLVALLAGK